ncbi:hypothetical protein [Streptomyces sp. CB03238]|uniref:hypothetical protein n=1 Tax=Streptomyces sp. CB03238 TaxID=1907777 RepID=UPI0015C48DC0|nr:hypothetical protein [Streptomyces sp. CB03238]
MDRTGVRMHAITRHYQPQTCNGCGGQKGHVETTFREDGTRIDMWRPCGTCQGTGVR